MIKSQQLFLQFRLSQIEISDVEQLVFEFLENPSS